MSDIQRQAELLQRKLDRERRARMEAEALLDGKSLEIFRMNEQLSEANRVLDRRVQERTAELSRAKSEIEQQACQLKAANERFEMVMRASGAAVWEWNLADSSFHFSRRMLELLDYPEDTLGALMRERSLVHPVERPQVERAMQRHLLSRLPLDVECRLRLSDGRYRWFRVVGDSVWRERRRLPLRFAGSITDIDEQIRRQAVIERLAKFDGLTDIPNRARFTEALETAITEADMADESFAVLVINLNDFKSINDGFGYAAGDTVLKEVADALQRSVKGYDVAARLGGDEFGIILKRIEQKRHIDAVCRKILCALRDDRQGFLREAGVTACIGVALYPGNGESSHELLVHADLALEHARKRRHRNGGHAFYDPRHDSEPRNRRRLEHHLEKALENEEFCIDYQAEALVPERHVIGAEALLRWQHPERGRLAPAEFIAAAESSGLIVAIGEWVINRVCADLQHWLQLSDQARVAINLSPVQLSHGDVVETIQAALDRHHCLPGCLEVEVTENVLLHDLERARRVLNELHELGVMISLDDFGSGYSSLAYLQQLPIDKVKIDRMFVSRMVHDENSRTITETIIRLAHTLNMQVLAEGVEQQQQFDLLCELDCDLVQGFLIARPQPFDEFLRGLELAERYRPLRLRPRLQEA